MNSSVAGRAGLLEILSWARPHNSETERRFCVEYLDKVPGMGRDEFGNRMLRIGDAPVMWSCHVDTVAAKCGPQKVAVDEHGIAGLAHGKAGMSLGADDGAGIWIMLSMIAAERPGLYVFHRGEERGCLGSSWLRETTPEVLAGLKAAIAFDRAGYRDVITHQASGRTCSDAFAKSMSDALNGLNTGFRYAPDDTGIYTDTNEYAGHIPECTNLSVGYFGQHGPRETLDLGHCEALLDAMLKLDFASLTIERDPADQEDAWGWLRSTKFSSHRSRHPDDEMVEVIEAYPYMIAKLLREAGFDAADLMDAAWAECEDDREERAYIPLVAS